MLAVLALPVLLFSQMAMTHFSGPVLRDLEYLSDLLEAEKRAVDRKRAENSDDFFEKCEQEPIELGLIIDSSVSIKLDDYQKGLDFLASFLSDYVIQPDKVRVAAVAFGNGVYTEDSFELTTYTSEDEVVNHVQNKMPFKHGTSTDTGLGLKYMREVLMNDGVTRPWAPKFVVVLTDGNSQRRYNTSDEAALTKKANITVFAVGVGHTVKYEELLNIAGGIPSHVIQTTSYDALDESVKGNLTTKTCRLVPKPTTKPPPTTTTLPQTQPCGEKYPTDVNFVFSPAALGLSGTNFVTNFISRLIQEEDVQEGFQFGAMSADCPNAEGFPLMGIEHSDAIRDRLDLYLANKLPVLISRTTHQRFEVANGGRSSANKVAVVFMGPEKMKSSGLEESLREMMDSGVRVFVSSTTGSMANAVPDGVTVLSPVSPYQQVLELISYLCHTY